MICAACRHVLPPGAAYCPHCAAIAAYRMANEPGRVMIPSRKKSKAPLFALGLLALGAIAYGAFRAGQGSLLPGQGRPISAITPGRSSQNDSLLAGQSDSVAPLTQTISEQDEAMLPESSSAISPVLQQQSSGMSPVMAGSTPASAPVTQQNAGMPSAIRDWLEHLRRTEDARIRLAQQQIAEAATTYAGLKAEDITSLIEDDDDLAAAKQKRNNRTQRAGDLTSSMRQEWVSLSNSFDSEQPPSECVEIRNTYDQVLSETGAMMDDIVQALASASSNPQAALQRLYAMQGKSKTAIDVPAGRTDDMVSGLCQQYGERKWFSISSDVGSGALMALGG